MDEPVGTVFLDFDGVLNCMTFARPDPKFEQAYVEDSEGYEWKLIWNPYLIERINETIQDNPKVDFLWLTTWGSDARNIVAPAIGLEDFKVLKEPPNDDKDALASRDEDWWKLKAVQEYYENDDGIQRYAWVDDDLAVEIVARKWCVNKRIYTVAPRPHTGMLSADLTHITTYFKPARYP